MRALERLREELEKLHINDGKRSLRIISTQACISHTLVRTILECKKVPSEVTLRALVKALGGNPEHFEKLRQEAQEEFRHVGGLGAAKDSIEAEAQEWRVDRLFLNGRRKELALSAASFYDQVFHLGTTGLITRPDLIPDAPVELSSVHLKYEDMPDPQVNGTEDESSYVRPRTGKATRYVTYTEALGKLAPPSLFFNAFGWRLGAVDWGPEEASIAFGDTTYFEMTDVCEAVAHETAAIFSSLRPGDNRPGLGHFPFRSLIGDPFDFSRRPILPAISTLMIRDDVTDPRFWLQKRDKVATASAAGMLQVIPSGAFQPANPHSARREEDFDLWRNIMRETAEELLGLTEFSGNRKADYTQYPFDVLDEMYERGDIRVHCLGVGLDALTLFGEIMTVAVLSPRAWDWISDRLALVTVEGTLQSSASWLSEQARLAPAGASCLQLAWKHRDLLLS